MQQLVYVMLILIRQLHELYQQKVQVLHKSKYDHVFIEKKQKKKVFDFQSGFELINHTDLPASIAATSTPSALPPGWDGNQINSQSFSFTF